MAPLHQDANVTSVGEIRDAERAREALACRAALVGWLVLSTLHVNGPEEAPVRLRDLGVEDYLVEAVLRGVLGQELRSSVGVEGRTVGARLA